LVFRVEKMKKQQKEKERKNGITKEGKSGGRYKTKERCCADFLIFGPF